MTYRLYRRDPITKGHWYYSVTCKGCEQPIVILDDSTHGKAPSSISLNGRMSIPCLKCAHDDIYISSDIRNIQAKENMQGGRPDRLPISNSSRKPLWNSYPKAKATFGVGYIEDRPIAAQIVGRIITSWADIEVECARLLAEIMGTKIPAAAAVFGALRSSRTQHDALSAAAEAVLDGKDLELFAAHMSRKSSLEKERNDLAHGCFGVSVAIPEHIVWVAQADFLSFSAGGGDAEKFRKKQFVYELGVLERIAQEITQFYQQLSFFRGYLWARGDGPNGESFRSQRYPELCSQPHIRHVLDRARNAKKSLK